jgi:tetratricopeptide (TPR) repeat protein
LDGLPLALATAGAYLDQVAISFSDYLRLYKASWAKLQKTSPELSSYEDRTLYSTWQLSLDHVKQQNELSAKLLRLWAYFDNQDIWYELLRHGDLEDLEWIRELTEDELSFSCAVRVLSNYGLVEVDTSLQEWVEARGYSIHGCVHSWTIHVLNQEWDYGLARLALKFVGSHVPREEVAGWWLIQRRLLQHAARCSDLVLNGLVADDGMAWACHSLGYLYADQDKLGEAEKMYQRALQWREEALGPDHTSTLDTVNNLGNLYKSQDKLDEAEKMYQRALQGYEKACGLDHTSILDTVNNLGSLYADQGKVDEAEKMYQRALQGYEKAWDPDHKSTLDTVNNLGSLYADQGKLDEAEKIFQRVLQGYEKAWGLDHISTLNTVNNLGNLYKSQGKLDEAEKIFQRTLQGYEKAFGSEHTSTLSTLISMSNLASAYRKQGRLKEAEAIYQRLLAGKEKALGPDHTSTLDITTNTQGATFGQSQQQEQASAGANPWGTESRYRPGETSPPHSVTRVPTSRPKVLPQTSYLSIKQANLKTIRNKIEELNQHFISSGQKDISLNPTELVILQRLIIQLEQSAAQTAKPSKALVDGLNLVMKLVTTWPATQKLPGLDLLRLLVAVAPLAATYQGPHGQNIVGILESSGVFSDQDRPNNIMLAVRAFANLFKTEEGRALAGAEVEKASFFLYPTQYPVR